MNDIDWALRFLEWNENNYDASTGDIAWAVIKKMADEGIPDEPPTAMWLMTLGGRMLSGPKAVIAAARQAQEKT